MLDLGVAAQSCDKQAAIKEIGEISPITFARPLHQFPFCNCPAHDTTTCTGVTDFPYCCPAHWMQSLANHVKPLTPESLPSLITDASDDKEMGIQTNLEDPLSVLHHNQPGRVQIQVNTSRVATHGLTTEDQLVEWGSTTQISTVVQPADSSSDPSTDISDGTQCYGTCWKCQVPNADHLQVNCTFKKPARDTPIPQTQKQQHAKKR